MFLDQNSKNQKDIGEMKKKVLYLCKALSAVMILSFSGPNGEMVNGYKAGGEVRDFTLKNIDGQMVSLSDFENAKGLVVLFTCNTCPYAKAYESRVADLDGKYASKGFPVVAVNPNDPSEQPGDSMDEMIVRAAERGYTFPYLKDDSQEIAKRFGATRTPQVYVLNKESKTKFRVEYVGAIDDSPREPADVEERHVEDAIDALLEGDKPSIKEKRAIGCLIKWSNN